MDSPALLSLELSEKWKDRITTVVNDADMVVRMSGATVANLLMDVLEFDYQETLMEDVKQVRYETKDMVAGVYHSMGSIRVHSLFLLFSFLVGFQSLRILFPIRCRYFSPRIRRVTL